MDEELDSKLEGGKLNPIEVVAMLIYAGVVIYATVMFVSMLGESDVFGTGFAGLFAQGGAYAAGLTAILMPWAKRYWISEGWHEAVSYILWAAEVAILALNVILAFDVARGNLADSWVAWWVHLSPASPIMSIVTWGVLFVLSPGHKARQRYTRFLNHFTEKYQNKMLRALDTQSVDQMIEAKAKAAVEQKINKDLNLPLDTEYRGNGSRAYESTTDIGSGQPKRMFPGARRRKEGRTGRDPL